MEQLLNPVLVSVLVLCVLALANVHVILALLIATLVAGLLGGLGLVETVTVLIDGLGGQSETALSYLLLGILAVMVGRSGLPQRLVAAVQPYLTGRRGLVVFGTAALACLSQNVVPVHIAFIPILIPPLLSAFNRMKLDRRAMACALTFGLKAPYIIVPLGFGLILQGIIVREMTAAGMEVSLGQVPLAMAIPVGGMLIGLVFAVLVSYRGDRSYAEVATSFSGGAARKKQQTVAQVGQASVLTQVEGADPEEELRHWTWDHTVVVLALAVTLVLQLWLQSLVIAASGGVLVMFLLRAERWRDGEIIVPDGVAMMGTIAFIMLIASGYANVLSETGAINDLVVWMASWIGDSRLIGALVMLTVGLLITMGIGTSFGTVPVVAAIFVPLALSLGMSELATIALIGTAAAIGDAGSPASDSTLGPTAGLNADGQHNHIWDTCVPTFLHYNIPLFFGGLIAAMIF